MLLFIPQFCCVIIRPKMKAIIDTLLNTLNRIGMVLTKPFVSSQSTLCNTQSTLCDAQVTISDAQSTFCDTQVTLGNTQSAFTVIQSTLCDIECMLGDTQSALCNKIHYFVHHISSSLRIKSLIHQGYSLRTKLPRPFT